MPASPDYRWVVERSSVGLCGHCGTGPLDMLRVEPGRSPVYLNIILMCRTCKHIRL